MKLRLCLMLLCAAIGMSCTKPMDMNSITGITFDKTTLSLVVGTEGKLVATIAPAEAKAVAVKWTSSDPSVATVAESGKVAAIKVGTSNITATVGSFVATCVVTVTPAVLVSIKPASVSMQKGEKLPLTVSFDPEPVDKSVTWSSSDPLVATVSDTGEVEALQVGVATITATSTDGSKSSGCQVTVTPVVHVSIHAASDVVVKGAKLTLTVSLDPEPADKSITWSSGDDAIATVSQTGEVTGVEAGTVTITAQRTNGTAFGTLAITVLPALPPLPTLYVVGKEDMGSSFQARVWKNGAPMNLTLNGGSSSANGLLFDGSKLYVVGSQMVGANIKAFLWTDGVEEELPSNPDENETAGVVAKVGSTLYIAGSGSSQTIGKLWTNVGNESSFPETRGVVALAQHENDLLLLLDAVSGSNINRIQTKVNGQSGVYVTDGSVNAIGNAMQVVGTTVYVAGREEKGVQGVWQAKVWKGDVNGNYVATNYSDGLHDADIFGLLVVGSDVYAVGSQNNSQDIPVATVWKNGTVLYTLSDGTTFAEATGIVKFGDNLYISGSEKSGAVNQAKVWVNDKVLWTLSDPAKNSHAYAICLGQ